MRERLGIPQMDISPVDSEITKPRTRAYFGHFG
jgi:hypothetical protein